MTSVVQLLANEFALPISIVEVVVRTAPHRYKTFRIPKRNGRGMRTIAQPASEVKAFQRFLVNQVLSDLPVHDSASAYVRGRGIKQNALAHVKHGYLLKMDFASFFPSIKPRDLEAHLDHYDPNRFTEEDKAAISSIVFWKPRNAAARELCIGGPSSPFVSNTIMYSFDEMMASYCEERNIIYTRYADDLSFSTNEPGMLADVERQVKAALKDMEYPTLRINVEKTVHTSKKHFRSVTGLVLSSQGLVSLGRQRKRQIRAMLHRVATGKEPIQDIQQIRGYLAFALDVEPDFVNRLREKFGADLVDGILRKRFDS